MPAEERFNIILPHGKAAEQLYIGGLPSPEIEPASLLSLLIGLELSVSGLRSIPDVRGAGSSGALVKFATVDVAIEAMTALDGKALSTFAPLVVAPSALRMTAEARALWEAIGTDELNARYKGDGQPSDHVFIANMKSSVDTDDLQRLCSRLGISLLWSKFYKEWDWDSCGALLQLASEEEAAIAILALNGGCVKT
eukprot:TRINITY_DN10044_c0_g3_i2.p1 TRINITY_DN10044_c0_g3~~TRINITY_DN10044_c0_g3_i2.p1  ORF type:complete len:196 (-),score=38.79 TRINITY_DN10044_c0_g3_i2:54-641(-)